MRLLNCSTLYYIRHKSSIAVDFSVLLIILLEFLYVPDTMLCIYFINESIQSTPHNYCVIYRLLIE